MTTFPAALEEINRLFSSYLQLEILGMPGLSARDQEAAAQFGNQITAMKFLATAISETPEHIQSEWWIANGDDTAEFIAMAKAFIDSV